jgi:hypothetical protein
MKRVLVIINIFLLAAVACLCGWLAVERSNHRRLAQSLARANQMVNELQAAREKTNEVHEACRARIGELTRSFNSAADQLIAMSLRVRELEGRANAESSPSAAGLPPAASQEGSSLSATQAAPARGAIPPGPRFFETLYGTNHQVLGRNLEFSAVYGRRVAFKETGSSRRMAFDVDQLDPGVLADLGIDAAAQKALHLRQEKAWQQAEAASLALAVAEEQRRREQQAAREEAERKRQEQLQAQAAREAAEAEAQARLSADNPAVQRQNNYVVDPFAPGPPIPLRVPPWWVRPRPW